MNAGKRRRLARLCPAGDGRHLFVPMDHTMSDGPPELTRRFTEIAHTVARAGADALIMHKGRVSATTDPSAVDTCGLIVHLSASTAHGPDPDAKVLVGSVADAVRLGADAVSVHVNIGARTEPDQLVALGEIASDCEAHGVPLLAMVYARGPGMANPYDADVLAHAVNIALDLGADIVKTALPRPIASIDRVIAGCAGRLIFSGGATDAQLGILEMARFVLDAGAAGLAVGRQVWTDCDPGRVVSDLASIVHPPLDRCPVSPTVDSLTREMA